MTDKTDKMTFFASIGSVISGLLASLCCVGPLVFVVLGLSGAAFFTQFEEYRLLFGAIALGFLVLGFFFAYREKEECTPGTSCEINPRRRRFNKIILWVATVLVIAAVSLPNIIAFFIT